MPLSKVVKLKCYLHTKTNTDNMHICLNFVIKQEHTINGSISSKIVHLLKVKFSL